MAKKGSVSALQRERARLERPAGGVWTEAQRVLANPAGGANVSPRSDPAQTKPKTPRASTPRFSSRAKGE